MVIDLDHDLVVYPFIHIFRCPLSEFLNQVVLALLLVIDSRFLEMINYPFVIGRSHLNVSLDDLLYFFFRHLVVLLLKAPVLLGGVLYFVIDRVEVANIVIRDYRL